MKKRRLKKALKRKFDLCIYTYARLYTNAHLTAYKIANSEAEIPQELKEKMLDLCLFCESISIAGYKEWKQQNEKNC